VQGAAPQPTAGGRTRSHPAPGGAGERRVQELMVSVKFVMCVTPPEVAVTVMG
jgi:hypothetical protein